MLPELELVTRAATVAGDAHRTQLRKDGDEPYVNHPLRVAHQATRAGLGAEAVAAALLHDVVEDTDWSHEDIEREFPPRVAQLTRLLTKWWPDDAPQDAKAEGKPVYYGAIAADPDAVTLKLLDRSDNLLCMVRMLPRRRDWCARYLKKTTKEIVPLADICGNDYAKATFGKALAALAEALERSDA